MPVSTEKAASKEDSEQSGVRPPTISLPKGGGAIRGIGEKFAANPVTGTGSMTVPIATSPGRSGFGPQLSLSYDSGAGNGPFGFGWISSLPHHSQDRQRACPSTTTPTNRTSSSFPGRRTWFRFWFKSEGIGGAEELRSRTVSGQTYRSSAIARASKDSSPASSAGPMSQIPRTRSGAPSPRTTSRPGTARRPRAASPIQPMRPASSAWLICESYDDKGNVIVYDYKPEDSARRGPRAGSRAES